MCLKLLSFVMSQPKSKVIISKSSIHIIQGGLVEDILAYKVIIEKSRSGRFLWNRNWHLGWIWANWQYWKKGSGPIMSNFWGWFFMFSGAKKILTFFLAPENMKNPPSKVAHDEPRPFFSVLPIGPNPARISISVP